MAEQLSFPLPRRDVRGRDAFFVTEANALAVAQVDGWRDWVQGKLVLVGPTGAGKTHLAHVWAAQSGAEIVDGRGITRADIAALAERPVVVDDADRIPRTSQAQAMLFHLHNLTLANGQPLLMTASAPPCDWHLTLPDLASRMEATATATLAAPDDPLLAAVLVKLFADRQIAPPPRLIDYCLKRMDRSFSAAQALVEALDRRSMATGRPIGVQLAAEVLDKR